MLPFARKTSMSAARSYWPSLAVSGAVELVTMTVVERVMGMAFRSMMCSAVTFTAYVRAESNFSSALALWLAA
jgi:hypothetical protein